MSVRVVIDARKAPADTIRDLDNVIRSFSGDEAVYVELRTSNGPMTMLMDATVEPVRGFYDSVRNIGLVAVPE